MTHQEQIKVVFTLLTVLLLCACSSQKYVLDPEIDLSSINYYTPKEVDAPPIPQGGNIALSKNVNYPLEALRQGLQGRVIMKFLITKEGEPYFLHFVDQTDSALDKAAIDAVKRTEFQPALKDTQYVNSITTIPINFQSIKLINDIRISGF